MSIYGDPIGRTIDIVHAEIHEGCLFAYTDIVTLSNNGTQDYVITTPDTVDEPHIDWLIEAFYGIQLDIYEATDRTPTTAQTIVNRNRRVSTTPTVTVHKGQSSGTTDGTKIYTHKAGTSTAAGKLSGTMQSRYEFILKKNTKYIFRVTSLAASNDVSVELNWYEHT